MVVELVHMIIGMHHCTPVICTCVATFCILFISDICIRIRHTNPTGVGVNTHSSIEATKLTTVVTDQISSFTSPHYSLIEMSAAIRQILLE